MTDNPYAEAFRQLQERIEALEACAAQSSSGTSYAYNLFLAHRAAAEAIPAGSVEPIPTPFMEMLARTAKAKAK